EPVDERRIGLFEEEKKMLAKKMKTRSALTCPECNGSLTETEIDGTIEFRCHVGHAFSLDSMIAEQAEQVEAALWAAIRALEESEMLAQRMANSSGQQLGYRFQEKAQAMRQHAALIRRILLSGTTLVTTDAEGATEQTPPEKAPI